MREAFAALSRWPLLVTGLAVIALGIGLLGEADEKSQALALILGLGSVLVGAGIVRVVEHGDPDRDGAGSGSSGDDPAP